MQMNLKHASDKLTAQRLGPQLWWPRWPTRQTAQPPSSGTPLRWERHYTGKLPSRSRVGRLLERGSASLEGWMPPRVRFRLAREPVAPLESGSTSLGGWTPPRARFCLARGPCGLVASAPAPQTGAFNALTFSGAQVKDESTPRPSHA
jgi:hypothetical protein